MTVNLRVRRLHAFMRFCYTEGYINESIHENFKPIIVPEDTIQSLTPGEVKLLISSIDDQYYASYRDKKMILVLLDTMVRISELLEIKRSTVDLKAGFIQLEAIDTKTRKARIVPLSSKSIKLLTEY